MGKSVLFARFARVVQWTYPRCNRLAVPSSNQCWLTCERPEDLVAKYAKYAHGDPKKERRIVLDKDTLLRITQAGNLWVVPREDLLERFLSTLREQVRLAAEADEHLLILIFGHGDPNSYGVFVGGKGDPEKAPILHMNNVKRLLPKNASVTLLMTSCFSGGWLVQPDLTDSREELLNTTGVTAAGPTEKTRSWPLSRSVGRASGSTVATAILQSLIDIEAAPEEQEVREHPTYIQLAHSIFETLKKIDRFREDQQTHFAAQDDEWETEYRRRLGLPLASYKDRWESLRKIPAIGGQGSGEGTISRTGHLRKRQRVRSSHVGILLHIRALTSGLPICHYTRD
ncbi:hypothetical protein VTN77DRAFT_7880 [Rasamsonia byssochlamydoides]|uniref:uncharacterized protein n=1 Tax=Rasamsonia byssochlamydoides TaxID=89139 RepID=UPI00374291B9